MKRFFIIPKLFVCALVAILGLLWASSALADSFSLLVLKTPTEDDSEANGTVSINFYLAESLRENVPYVRDDRTLSRDAFVPSVEDGGLFSFRKTDNVVTWLLPVPYAESVDIFITFPEQSGVTTAYLNEQELKTDTPITVTAKDEVELKIANQTKRGITRFIFTTMPVVSLTYDGTPEKGKDLPAHIVVVDPEYEEHDSITGYFECDATVEKRGQSSAKFKVKFPLNITLIQNDDKYDHPLAGMRKDSDWILDSAYNDASRVRNRVLQDAWSRLYSLPWHAEKSGTPSGTPVEVYINGRYSGIYILEEKQDRKQLGLKKTSKGGTGVYIKTRDTNKNSESPAGFVSMGSEKPGATDITRWLNIEMKYPHEEDITPEMWDDIYEMTRLVIEGSDADFIKHITEYVDLDNLAKYYLFINAFDISDNMRKNMTFVRNEEGAPFQLIPWDMDASLGRYYSSHKSRVHDYASNKLFDRLIELNVGNFRDILATTWRENKDGALSIEGVMNDIRYYMNRFNSCNADEREKDLYPEFIHYLGDSYRYILKFEREEQYIEQYLREHYEFLEQEYASLFGL